MANACRQLHTHADVLRSTAGLGVAAHGGAQRQTGARQGRITARDGREGVELLAGVAAPEAGRGPLQAGQQVEAHDPGLPVAPGAAGDHGGARARAVGQALGRWRLQLQTVERAACRLSSRFVGELDRLATADRGRADARAHHVGQLIELGLGAGHAGQAIDHQRGAAAHGGADFSQGLLVELVCAAMQPQHVVRAAALGGVPARERGGRLQHLDVSAEHVLRRLGRLGFAAGLLGRRGLRAGHEHQHACFGRQGLRQLDGVGFVGQDGEAEQGAVVAGLRIGGAGADTHRPGQGLVLGAAHLVGFDVEREGDALALGEATDGPGAAGVAPQAGAVALQGQAGGDRDLRRDALGAGFARVAHGDRDTGRFTTAQLRLGGLDGDGNVGLVGVLAGVGLAFSNQVAGAHGAGREHDVLDQAGLGCTAGAASHPGAVDPAVDDGGFELVAAGCQTREAEGARRVGVALAEDALAIGVHPLEHDAEVAFGGLAGIPDAVGVAVAVGAAGNAAVGALTELEDVVASGIAVEDMQEVGPAQVGVAGLGQPVVLRRQHLAVAAHHAGDGLAAAERVGDFGVDQVGRWRETQAQVAA